MASSPSTAVSSTSSSAAATSSAREDLLSCPVCLELFALPVGLACGHTFCKLCIETHWAGGALAEEPAAFRCPVCCRVYRERPELSKNVLIAQLVEEFHAEKALEETSSASTAIGASRVVPRCLHHGKPLEFHCRTDGRLLCADCMLLGAEHWGHGSVAVETEYRARREQLDHFKQRLEEEERATTCIMSGLEGGIHAVLGAAEEAKARLVRSYDELLRLIAAAKEAAVTSVDEECRSKLAEIHGLVECCGDTLGRLQEALSAIYSLDDTREPVAFLEGCILNWESFTSLERERAELPAGPALACDASVPLQERVDELLRSFKTQGRLGPLSPQPRSKREPRAEAQSDAEESTLPPFTASQATQSDFDEDAEEVRRPQPRTENVAPPEEPYFWEMLSSLYRLFFGEATPSGPSQAELAASCGYTPTLNPDSAHLRLRVSRDLRTVRVTFPPQCLPAHPDRFDGWYQVLGRDGVSSGQLYWEVDVSRAGWCCVGVAYGSIARKGHGEECWLGHDDTSWALYVRGDEVTAQRRGVGVPVAKGRWGGVAAGGALRRVGVFVDFNGGLLSFYGADTMEPLHTYRHKFTRPLLPALGLYDLFVVDANIDNSLSIVDLE